MPQLRRSAVAGALLLTALASQGRALDPSQPFNKYIRTHFGDEDGLSNVVHEIVQSQDGFLWLSAGSSTLTRFDGRHFTEIPNLFAHVLAIAPDGDLWVGTDGGLERIPAAALNQFGRLPSTVYHPGPGPGSHVVCLRFSRTGVLWVGTAGGLYRFERGGFLQVIPRLVINRIEEASNGHLLVITSEGFLEWDGSRAVPHPELAKQLGVKPEEVFHVLEDSHGVTWYCTTQGVARRAGGSIQKLQPYRPTGHGAFRAYEDSQGTVWFSRAEGLFRATAIGLEPVVPGINVRYVYGDRDGALWIGTNGDGLIHVKDRAIQMFTTADGLPNKVIMTVLASHAGSLWTGANCGGLSRFDGRRFRTYSEKDGLRNSCVYALAEDANHDLWIGTYGGGVFRLRDGRFTQYAKDQGLASNIVTGIVPARDGSLWLATPEGVSRVHDGQVRNYTTADGLSSNNVINLYEDRSGAIWAGTGKGINRLAGDRFVNLSFVPKGFVLPIGEDRSGGFYVAGPQTGVLGMEKERPIRVTPDIQAFNMAETKQGDLWLNGTGVYWFPPGGLQGLRGRDEPPDYATFGRADGLDARECSFGFPNSAVTRDGKLWVATPQGLAMLDLPRLPRTNRKPAIYVREIEVGRNLQPPGHELVLPPGTHHVVLEFDSIEFTSPEKIRFQYRMDGVDPDWLNAGATRTAVYTSIPPGTHSFHIRACNSDGVWDRGGIVYNVIQQPYYYETSGFRLATIAFVASLILGVYFLRLRQMAGQLNIRFEERLRERTRIARDLHDTLLQNITGLSLQISGLSKIVTAPELAKDRLQGLKSQAEECLREARAAVWNLHSLESENLDLATELKESGERLSAGKAAQFSLCVEGEPRCLPLDLREHLLRIGREAIANSARHAKAEQIEVRLTFETNAIRLQISDNGQGFNLDDASALPGHFGLTTMRERAEQIRASIVISSEIRCGTCIEVTVPYPI
jgi:ligand-binding sensor domain-containing protein/two-component sensor histidine kinase